jgi:hypothetical protein
VQHELAPHVSLNVGYFRRWFYNFTVTRNLAVGPSDQPSLGRPLSGGAQNTTVNVISLSVTYAWWQVPLSVLNARLLKISAQLDF